MQDDSSRHRHAAASVAPTAHSTRLPGRKSVADEPVLGYHVILRLSDDRVIAATEADRRAGACIMIGQGRARRLLACAVVDAQAHAIVLCSRAEAGDYAGRTATSLRSALRIDVAFDRARLRPIRDESQLRSLFEQVLRRDEQHALSVIEFHDGTNLPDLVGLRVNGAYSRPLLQEHLPQVAERALLDRLQLDPLPFDPMQSDPMQPLEPSLLVEATLAATGRSSLKGRSTDNVAARTAAAAVARSRMSAPALAKLFGMNVRTAFRMRAARCDDELVSAIELQLRWRVSARRGASSGSLPRP